MRPFRIARGPGAARYSNLATLSGPPVEIDDAPLLGTPEEIIERLKRLEAGGVEKVLLVQPKASIDALRVFSREVMPAFTATVEA